MSEGDTAREDKALTRWQRTHSQMSGIDLNSILSHSTATSARAGPPEQSPTPPHSQTSRYSGDGFDFRRPITPSRAPSGTSNHHEMPEYIEPLDIVDLTNSEEAEAPPSPRLLFGRASRGPRFARNIIDLSGESPNSPPSSSHDDTRLDGGFEVQFVSERRLPATANSRRTPTIPPNNIFDLTNDDAFFDTEDDDDIQIIMERHRPDPTPPVVPQANPSNHTVTFTQNIPLLQTTASIANSLRQLAGYHIDGLNSGSSHSQNGSRLRSNPPSVGPQSNGPRSLTSARGPAMGFNFSFGTFVSPDLDFGTVGFDMGLSDDAAQSATAVRRPLPPLPPPPGFTRTPNPDEVYICPNCDRELCTGDTDIQKQIWIIRGCGHVRSIVTNAYVHAVQVLTAYLDILRRVREPAPHLQAQKGQAAAQHKAVRGVRRKGLRQAHPRPPRHDPDLPVSRIW